MLKKICFSLVCNFVSSCLLQDYGALKVAQQIKSLGLVAYKPIACKK